MTLNSILIVVTVFVYMAAMVLIGAFLSKKNKSTDDFYLGGRKLGPLVTAMSAEASDMSSYLLMGLPGVALAGALVAAEGGLINESGFAEAVWTAIGLAIGTYVNWLFVAKRLRKYSERVNASTVPDYFSNRFHDASGILVLVSALIIIVFFVPYTASGFASVGKLFNSLFGIDYHTAMLVGGAVIVVYTVLGGFLAASITDLIQSIIMTIALIVVAWFGISEAGGMSGVIGATSENYFSLTGAMGNYGFLPIVSTLAWGLGYFGMPHILLRFMAIEDDAKLKTSRRIASVWVVISMAVAIFIGVIGVSFVQNNNLVDIDPERIIIYISDGISKLGPAAAIIAGLIIAGILAATMSTADSQMLAAGSSMSENIVKRFMFKNLSKRVQMLIARSTICLIAVIAVIFAWNPDSSIFRVVSFAWAGFGAAFGPLMLCSLFWKRCNKYGAIAGVFSGGAMVFIWKFVIRPLGGAFDIYELLPAFIISLAFIIIVSLATPAPEKEIIEEFESVK